VSRFGLLSRRKRERYGMWKRENVDESVAMTHADNATRKRKYSE
jgi:hypothetical protein